mgnify:CR=1 FL=1
MIFNKTKVIENSLNKAIIHYLNEKEYPTDLEFVDDDAKMMDNKLRLGTHPDYIELLWNVYSKTLPKQCKAILYGTPVLINPSTSVVFGLAEGTYPPLLRLSKNDVVSIKQKGGKTTLSDMDGVYADAGVLGNEWVYCFSFINDIQSYCLNAYNYSNQ